MFKLHIYFIIKNLIIKIYKNRNIKQWNKNLKKFIKLKKNKKNLNKIIIYILL